MDGRVSEVVFSYSKNKSLNFSAFMSSDEEEFSGNEAGGDPGDVDEAELHEGLRAFFPVSFGKQEKDQVSLEVIHSTTKRSGKNELKPTPKKEDKKVSFIGPPRPSLNNSSNGAKIIGPRRPPSSSETAENGGFVGPPRPGPSSLPDTHDGDGGFVGPPRPGPFSSLRDADDDGGSGGFVGPPRPSPSALESDDFVGPPRPSPSALESDEFIGPPQSSPSTLESDKFVGPPRPPAARNDDEDDQEMIGPPPPSIGQESLDGASGRGYSDDEEEEEEDEDVQVEDDVRVPMSNEIVLGGHSKVVSALAIDHTGSRVLTGSYDYSVRMYDFQGMNSQLKSFRQFEPFEGHQVRSLSWSPTCDKFLCVTGSAQAKIYDRDGLTLGEFIKGDMYIRDLKNTKGHISGLTCGEWHPREKQTVLTSSEDGSLRLWDVNNFDSQKQVIKPKLSRPGRVPVTTCTWGRDGKCIAGGVGDGSIQIWSIKPGWGSRPDTYIKGHEDDITGIKFSADGNMLLSRSMDATLKVWDLRKTETPLKVFSDLPNNYGQTNVAFSPDEKMILTGTSIEKGLDAGGLLCFYDKQNLELTLRVGISPTLSVVQCSWHPRLNQVFATVGDKKEGGTHILYDPTMSERGALICVGRAPRLKSIDDFEVKPVIHNPHALPLFRDEPSRKRQREKARVDPMKSRRPDLPVTGPGFGGRVGTTKGSLLTQYLLKEGGLIKETWMEEDPREAILKYADVAAKNPKFIAPAYADTQPKTVFAESDSEEENK